MVEVDLSRVRVKDLSSVKAGPFVVACVPAFDEARSIAGVVLQAQRYVDRVIVCDDGSSDMTGEIAGRLGADVVRHERNLGYGVAVRSLFRRARELGADVVVTLDGDGQHDAEEIPSLVEPVLEGKADVVVGSRFLSNGGNGSGNGNDDGVPRFRRLGIKAITRLTGAASKQGLSDAQCGFRVYSRKALDGLNLCENGMGVSVEALLEAKRHGLTVVEVPTGCNYRGLEKTSTHNSVRHGASVIMSLVRLVVEEKPLLFLGVPGVFSLFLGALFGVWMLQIYALERHIVTNIALASMGFILIGLFAVFTAITLYAIYRSVEKIRK